MDINNTGLWTTTDATIATNNTMGMGGIQVTNGFLQTDMARRVLQRVKIFSGPAGYVEGLINSFFEEHTQCYNIKLTPIAQRGDLCIILEYME